MRLHTWWGCGWRDHHTLAHATDKDGEGEMTTKIMVMDTAMDPPIVDVDAAEEADAAKMQCQEQASGSCR